MYKKGLKIYALSFLLAAFTMQTTIVHAEIKDNLVVDKTKTWIIKFNNEVGFDEVTKQDINVKDNKENVIPTTLKLSQDQKSILVSPMG